MVIGIGLHCWYCEHGPCNGECEIWEEKRQQALEIAREEELQKKMMEKKERHEERRLIKTYTDKIKKILEQKKKCT